jgi:hypothetical protein
MAVVSNFKNANVPNVADGSWTVVYTTPVGMTSYFLQINIASLGAGGQASVRVWDQSASTFTYLVKEAPIPAGSALPCLVESNKLVLESGDRLEVISESPSILFDILTSLVEDVNA